MHAALALMPSALVLVLVLGFGASGLAAAVAAASATVMIWLTQAFGPVEAAQALHALADASVLTLLVAAMVVPGFLFVEATRDRKSPKAIAALVAGIGATGSRAAILVGVGIGVLVESLTGLGVSLLVTAPLLVGLFPRRHAIAIALLGVSLMPWGALAISAHVGAELAGLPLSHLQRWIVAVSGPVAFCLPLLAALIGGSRRHDDVRMALLTGAVFTAAIGLATISFGIEVGGVAGGLAVIALVVGLSSRPQRLYSLLAAPGLRPYVILIAAVVAQKLAIAPLTALGASPSVSTGRVTFVLLTSPGIALLGATIASASSAIDARLLASVAARAWRPVVAAALFMISARLLVECGAVAALAASVGGMGRFGATLAVAAMGAIGGFVTGSGVTGNALFMPSAAASGAALGTLPIFAALQNAASGHVALASLPVAAVLLAALPERVAGDDQLAMRTGLALAGWHLTIALTSALVLVALAH